MQSAKLLHQWSLYNFYNHEYKLYICTNKVFALIHKFPIHVQTCQSPDEMEWNN